jgi:hypothetical protein
MDTYVTQQLFVILVCTIQGTFLDQYFIICLVTGPYLPRQAHKHSNLGWHLHNGLFKHPGDTPVLRASPLLIICL